MKGTLSLAEELRAIRGVGNPKTLFKNTPELEAKERPWQADIDQVQQTLRELLRAVSRLSGVELPGGDDRSPGAGDSLPQLDCKTLKDRIRNDLEAFSVTTAAEMIRRAEEQARAALSTIQTEVSGQMDQVAGELREKLQVRLEPEQLEVDLAQRSRDRVAELVQAQTDQFARWVWLTCKGTGAPIPAQIEKLLEPYVEEATARFGGAFQQKVQDLLAEQEQLAREKFEAITSSLQSQISALEQASLQVCEQNADQVAMRSTERLSVVADEAARNFEGRLGGEMEGVMGRFQARLEEAAAARQESLRQQREAEAEAFQHQLQGLASEAQQKQVSEIMGRIEQTAADVMESSVQHLHHQANDSMERSKEELKGYVQGQVEEAREQIREVGWSTHESLKQDAARLTESVKGLDEELTAVEKKHLAASEEQVSRLIQQTVERLTEHMREVSDRQMEEIGRFAQESRERVAPQYEAQFHEVLEGQYQSATERIQKQAGEAGARLAAEIKAVSESAMQELSNRLNDSMAALNQGVFEATSRIESSVQGSMETHRQQLAEITEAGIQQQRLAMSGNMAEIHNRLKQAAQLLAPNNPQVR